MCLHPESRFDAHAGLAGGLEKSVRLAGREGSDVGQFSQQRV
jgi:hypothetical protein